VIVNVGRDDNKAATPDKKTHIELPNDAERIGKPIRFERGQSTPLNKAELERIVRELRDMKARFEFRVVLTSRADIEKGSTPDRNQELSEQRANVCRAYMLENGISVHQVVCIGSSLAESTAEHERQVIFHVIDKVERKVPDAARTVSR
jgi:outer membrane protein OmpA-like peptidoglycan-associated protein